MVLELLQRAASPVVNHFKSEKSWRGIPARSCPECGCDLLVIAVTFDEDNEIGGYFTGGHCAACHCKVTVPTAIDTLVLS